MDKVEFLGIVDPGSTALKVSGSENGGKITLAFDDSQTAQVLKLVLWRNALLDFTITPHDDYAD